MIDTRWTRAFAPLVCAAKFAPLVCAAGFALLAISCASSKPPAEIPMPAGRVELVGARVIFERGTTVYVGAPESLWMEPGTPFLFLDRDRLVGEGRLEQVHKGTLAEITLTSGDLPSRVFWDRLRIATERRTFAAPPLLRIGYPARYPKSIPCAVRPIPPTALAGAYRTELIGERSWRGVRVSPAAPNVSAPWPDTLLIRLFEDSVDEEIALQRREIDAAVFWDFSRFAKEQFRDGAALSGRPRRWSVTVDVDFAERVGVADSLRALLESCPIVTTKELRPYLTALGPDSLVNLLSCEAEKP